MHTFVMLLMCFMEIQHRMHKLSKVIFCLALALSLSACSNGNSSQVESVAEAFATSYFNWRYAECMQYVTGESAKYMKFLATNVTDGDIERLRSKEKGADVEVEKETFDDNDTIVDVKVKVSDFCYADTIGCKSRLCDKAEATLRLVKRGNEWKAVVSNEWPKMAFPQQSGTQGRD